MSSLLIAKDRIIGGVVVQDDLLRGLSEAVQERVNEDFVQLENRLGTDAVFKA